MPEPTPSTPTPPSPAPGEGAILDGSAGISKDPNDTLLGSIAPPVPPVENKPAEGGVPVQDTLPFPGGQGLTPLPDNATDSQKEDFTNKLRAMAGVPKAPEDYGTFGFDDSVKIDTNSGVYKHWTKVFHDVGVNQAQAKKLLEAHNQFISSEMETHKRQTDQQILEYRAQMKAALTRDVGGESQYEALRNSAQQGFSAVAKGAKLSEPEIKGMLNIMGDDSRFVKIFAHIGTNFREDVLITGSSPGVPEKTMDDIIDDLFKSS